MNELANGFPQNIASTKRRLLAFAVDLFIGSLFYLPFVMHLQIRNFLSQEPVEIPVRVLIGCFATHLVYQWLFLKLLSGTPGKLFLGLRVVNRNTGGELGWMQALIRLFANVISAMFGYSFYAFVFFRFDRTHLSDWIAETQVRQFVPRSEPARRRPVFGLLLFLVLFVRGFMSTYNSLQNIEWKGTQVIVYPPSINDESE